MAGYTSCIFCLSCSVYLFGKDQEDLAYLLFLGFVCRDGYKYSI